MADTLWCNDRAVEDFGLDPSTLAGWWDAVGQAFAFTAAGVDQYGDPFPVSGGTWATSNPALATIDGSGVATGVAAGEVDVTYTLNGVVHS